MQVKGDVSGGRFKYVLHFFHILFIILMLTDICFSFFFVFFLHPFCYFN